MTAGWLHDPDAVLDYSLDFSAWLTEISDELDSAAWTVPAGLTKVGQAISASTATAVISGGTAGENYAITCHIVTVGGLEDDRTIHLYCRER